MQYDFDEDLKSLLKERADKVRENILAACKASGRDASEVTLIGVSKMFPVEYAEAAFCGGISDLGENKVQELVPKIERFEELDLHAKWHLIGTLQKNKVKYIVGKTHLIHSVNTLDLAAEISKRSVNAGIVTDILLQVNVSGEESKHGFDPSEANSVTEAVNAMEGVRVRGLMTMAPIQTYDGEARPVFAKTRELFESLKGYVKAKDAFDTLSMGMSQDYVHAVAEGSTYVRIGTDIFGKRNYGNI